MTSSSESFSIENAGLSFSWDSANQQEHVPVIRPGGGRGPGRAGIHPGLHHAGLRDPNKPFVLPLGVFLARQPGWPQGGITARRLTGPGLLKTDRPGTEVPSGAASGTLSCIRRGREGSSASAACPLPPWGLWLSGQASANGVAALLSYSCHEAQTRRFRCFENSHGGNAGGGPDMRPCPGPRKCSPCALPVRQGCLFLFWLSGEGLYTLAFL